MRRKSNYRATVTMLLMCIMINPMVLEARGYGAASMSDDLSLLDLAAIGLVLEVFFCFRYFIKYIKGECKSSSLKKRLVAVIVLGSLLFILLFSYQKVYKHNSESYSVKTQYDSSLKPNLKYFTVSDKTIPQGVYQVSISNNSPKIRIDISPTENSKNTVFEKKIFGTKSLKIADELVRSRYNNSGNSFTVVLPEGSHVSVSSVERKDYNTEVTFKKVDTLKEINHLSSEENGLSQIPNNIKKLKIDVAEKNNIRTFDGPSTSVYTFNKEHLIIYNFYKDGYVEFRYKILPDSVIWGQESQENHYYKDEEVKNGQISVDLLSKTFSSSYNNPYEKNSSISTD